MARANYGFVHRAPTDWERRVFNLLLFSSQAGIYILVFGTIGFIFYLIATGEIR